MSSKIIRQGIKIGAWHGGVYAALFTFPFIGDLGCTNCQGQWAVAFFGWPLTALIPEGAFNYFGYWGDWALLFITGVLNWFLIGFLLVFRFAKIE